MNIQLLEGKSAIITGASEGIGYAISELFAKEGAAVYMIARRKEKLDAAVEAAKAAAGSDKVYGISGSVADKELMAAVCKRVYEEQGAIDILVNNAGVANTISFDTTPDEEWDRVMDTNVDALFRWCKAVAPYMLEKHSGSIINVSSCCGVMPVSGAAYSVSKGAVNALTKNMAYRFVGSGVRCNALLPGRVVTPLQTKKNDAYQGEGVKVNMHQFGDHYVNRELPPLQVEGQAYPALFLASDLFSKDINGVWLPVDAGSYMP